MSKPIHGAGTLLLLLLLAGGGATALPLQDQSSEQDKPKAEETKKEKEKKKKEKSSTSEPSKPLDTRQLLSRVLRNFKDGFEGRSPSSLRENIDEKKFYDFPRFEEGVTEFLRSTGELRLFIREVNVQVQDDRAVMMVDAEMLFGPRDDPSQSQRRKERITFDFQRTPDGWKITEINPRPFFLP